MQWIFPVLLKCVISEWISYWCHYDRISEYHESLLFRLVWDTRKDIYLLESMRMLSLTIPDGAAVQTHGLGLPPVIMWSDYTRNTDVWGEVYQPRHSGSV